MDQINKVPAELPGWFQRNHPARVKDKIAQLYAALKASRYKDAEKAATAILEEIRN